MGERFLNRVTGVESKGVVPRGDTRERGELGDWGCHIYMTAYKRGS